MISGVSNIVEVDPARGNDAPNARPHHPYRTITAALAQLQGATLVNLAAGFYSKASGERFPITLGGDVILNGPTGDGEQAAIISGGGPVSNFKGLVALVLTETAQLRGVSVHNSLGSAVLVSRGRGLIQNCHFSRCSQHGVVVLDTAMPQVLNTRIEHNGGAGIQCLDQSKGVIADCALLNCETGITLAHAAAPLIRNNQVKGHQVGIQTAGSSSPVLRNNRIVQNHQRGLHLLGNSRPDLGHPQDPADNVIRNNGQVDLHNATSRPVTTVGNDLLPQRLRGRVELTASQLPDPRAVPRSLLDQPMSARPGPAAQAPQIERRPPSPTFEQPGQSRFADVQDHWAAPYIEALAQRGLIKGYDDGQFRPNASISRAQLAAMVAASFPDQPQRKPAERFRDVLGHHWASNAIAQAQRQGFISGYPDQSFRPDQPITRAQAIVAVAQGLRLSSAPANVLSIYRDRAQIPSYATDALAAATRHRLIVNYPQLDLLRPLAPITRGEVASLIYQGLVTQDQAPPLSDKPLVEADLPQGSFPDIQDHWAQDFIQALLNKGLIRGYDDGRFYPDRPMTRAQFAAIIQAGFHPSPQQPAQPFRDVEPNHWAHRAIQVASRGGFLSGFPDGSFGPDHNLLRVQIWVALVNGLNLLPRQKGNLALVNQYQDSGAIPAYALNAVAKGTQLKLVVNAPNIQRLNPNQVATRADISAVIYQTLVHLQRAPGINHPFIVYP